MLDDVHGGHGLHGVDLSVDPGELLVVLGPSGAGKTTLLRIVAGLESAARGRVLIAGEDVTALRPGRRNVSMVFQSYALFPHLTVVQNIEFGLVVRDVSKRQARSRARRAAAVVGCAELLERRPWQLSGGERQRVALARALVREPDVFLLDEPLSNLDAELRVGMRAELRALHERTGGTMVHVTHDQVEAQVLGDRIAVLRDGRLEQVAAPEEIWRRPATTFVARFVGSPPMNLVPVGGLLGGALAPGTEPGRLIGFRPEAVRLPAPGNEKANAGEGERPGADGTVRRVEVIGEDAYVHLDCGGAAVIARVPVTERPAAGAELRLEVAGDDLHRFDAVTGERVRG